VRRGGGRVCFVSTALHSSMWEAAHIHCAWGCYAMYVWTVMCGGVVSMFSVR
jgi:hypothetical protein